VNKVYKARRARPDLRVHLVPQVRKVQLAFKDRQVLPVPLVSPEPLVHKEIKALLVLLVHKEIKALLG
jgi:hypothetical protein